jgi:hypothetical protein
MKYFVLFLLFSMNAMAAEYLCRTQMINMRLNTDADFTTLEISHIQSGEYYYEGVVDEIQQQNGITTLVFKTGPQSILNLEFQSSEIESENEKLFGFVHGKFSGGLINNSSLKCLKQTI